ncbi:N/A [soil metagenome]
MKLEGLDHIALAVRNVEESMKWYGEVLGLERQHADVWNDIPIFVGQGQTGIALFPVEDAESSLGDNQSERMLHFALRADGENFEQAQRELKARGIEFRFEDHGIAHSIYFRDPNGLNLEITTYEVSDRR